MTRLDDRLNALSPERRKLVEQLLGRKEATSAATGFQAPETPEEESLAGIWCEVLGLKSIGVEDDFVAIGGDSIRAIQISARARRAGLVFGADQCFRHKTIRQLARALEVGGESWVPSARDPSQQTPGALSYGEQRLWIEHELHQNTPAGNTFTALRLDGRVHVDALEQTVQALALRHEALRTRYRTRAGQVQREIVADLLPELIVLEGDAVAGETEEARLRQIAAEQTSRPFDLTTAPLFRCVLVTFDGEPRYLILIAHHIICDAWSMNLLLAELARVYEARVNGLPSPLEPLQTGYAEFAQWQRESVSSGRLEEQLAYWCEELQDAPRSHTLPLQHPRPAARSYRGQVSYFRLEPDTVAAADRYAKTQGVTRFVACLSAYVLVVHALGGGDDIVVGTPLLGRPFDESQRLVGFFLNTAGLRARVDKHQPVAELTQRVGSAAAEALRHQDVPYDLVLEKLRVERSAAHSPLFQLWFVVQTGKSQAVRLADLTLTPVELQRTTSVFDLALSLQEDEAGISGWIEYNTDIFDPGFIERLKQGYAWILDAMDAAADEPVATLLAGLSAEEAAAGKRARDELRRRIRH
ncbi:hypothetical protein GCM10009745_41010 [Kribbella yunnanensis]|uniref:Carrier domain-containing protein n=1 Tax=Kribbella yunnanensis TaxID=190194 RepID=A0ABP4TQ96_9ACTN